MFKSLQVKLITIFVLLVLAIMSVAGTFLVLQTYYFHCNSFKNDMNSVFTEDYISDLKNGLSQDESYVNKIISEKYQTLGIDSCRSVYIVTINPETDALTDRMNFDTENFNKASSGEYGTKIDMTKEYLDYAIPVESENKTVIIYIRDTKEKINKEINKIIISKHRYYIRISS